MTTRWRVPVVVGGMALALPARAFAVDHVVLDISAVRIAAAAPAKASKQERARLRALARWRLDGRVVGRDFYRAGDAEIFGVTLTRAFANGRELHAFRAAPNQTVTFDGTRGRFAATFGRTLAVRMEIVARGLPHPAEAPLPCRGNFVKVPVTLHGTFVLRTGTKFFKTIRRASLPGVVSFASGGPVDCTPQQPTECGNSSVLSASTSEGQPGLPATLLMSPDENGWTTLSFADPGTSATWYHVMYALGANPLSAAPPTIAARLTAPLPIQGNGTFTAEHSSTAVNGACQSVSTTGTFTGTFRTQFAGWGTRTATFTAAGHAQYTEQRQVAFN